MPRDKLIDCEAPLLETGFLALELNAGSASFVLCACLVLAKRRRGAGLIMACFTVQWRDVLPARRVRERRPAVRRRGRAEIVIVNLNGINLKVVLDVVEPKGDSTVNITMAAA